MSHDTVLALLPLALDIKQHSIHTYNGIIRPRLNQFVAYICAGRKRKSQ